MNTEDLMKMECTYYPVTEKKRVFPFLFLVIGISSLFVVASGMIELYKGLLSLVGIMGFTVSIYLLTRYVVSDFAYSVFVNTSDELLITVTKTTGKRTTTLYCAALKELKSIQLFTKNELKKRRPQKGTLLYNLAPSFCPETVHLVTFENSDGRTEIILECTVAFASRLCEAADIARAFQHQKYEDE